MPRVIKHPDIRRQELLDIAARSFAEHGYDSTTVDDVIRQAGLSKGAFYYYYPSKQALLEGLATAAATRALEALQPVMNASGLGAVDRLNAFLRQGRQTHDAAATLAVFESIFRPDNVVLYHRMHAAVMAVMLPPLTEILAQGVAEGSIRSNDPRTTAELVLMLGTMTHDVVGRLLGAKPQEWAAAIAAFEHRLVEQGIAVDRILGLPDGTVAFVEPGFAEAMFASRRP
ncbi:MAG: TetR/AcrR family transcriptional regulator [Hyphomicrobiales bacterium]|nr:MAG: TetR/AcrR family transcriptional regulator [Hyphomicrobiales bacterium]